MKYTTEDLTTCSKKITVTVEAEECDAAITTALKMQQQGLSLAGFRKGHVPLSIIEKRFRGQVYADAAQDLANVHLNQIIGELKVKPVSAINVDPTPIPLKRGTDVTYMVTFEHMPVFAVPAYESLEVLQKEAPEPAEERVNEFIERLRGKDDQFAPIEGDGPAVDGQLVNIDLDVLDGETVLHSAKGQDLMVGQPGAEQIDEIVKGLKIGETGEKEVDFPEDFMLPLLQGRKATVKIRIYAIKAAKKLSDEELLKKLKMADMDVLRTKTREVLKSQLNALHRSETQSMLISTLLKMVDFELPPALIRQELDTLIQQDKMRAMRVGKALSDEQVAELEKKHLDTARTHVKTFVLLLAIAEREGLTVPGQEVQAEVTRQAGEIHVDPRELYDYYRENGQLYAVRDRLLVDKAAQAVYSRAKVKMVPEGGEAE